MLTRCSVSGLMWKTFGSLWSRGYTPQGRPNNPAAAALHVPRTDVTPSPGIVRLMGPGGPAMVRSAMSKRFPAESPEAVEMIAPYLYQITAAQGSGEYALNLLLEPGAWARRPLCERLLPLQGTVCVISLSLGVVCVAGITHARSARVFRVRQQRLDGPAACARPRVEACCPCICESCSSVYFIMQMRLYVGG